MLNINIIANAKYWFIPLIGSEQYSLQPCISVSFAYGVLSGKIGMPMKKMTNKQIVIAVASLLILGVVVAGAHEYSYTRYKSGYESGEDKGYDKGRSEGYDDGKNEGYEEGHEEGHAEGYNEGYEEGYEDGYNKGYYHGQSNGYWNGYLNRSYDSW